MIENNKTIILGIDPGTAKMGFGVVSKEGSYIKHIEHGVLETDPETNEHIRLNELYTGLNTLIKKHSPSSMGVEDIFYFKNKKTVIKVSQARGLALLSAAQNDIDCYSFTPLQVKQAVTGYGQADKNQIQEMIKVLLKLEEIPKLDDAADALAVAICCANSLTMLNISK